MICCLDAKQRCWVQNIDEWMKIIAGGCKTSLRG
jgi:hypothetical protein